MSTRPTARPIAPYIGGKRVLARRLCPLIDGHEHRLYAEPFVGMGGVFLRRKRQRKAEFINDRGFEVYNLFRILQEHYVAFLDLLRFQITTQSGFDRLLKVEPETLTDLQRAARFLYVQRNSFGGQVTKQNFALDRRGGGRFNLTTLESDLEALHQRLAGVSVTCLDWAAFVQRLDRPDTLFYLDPPYLGCEDDYGEGLFDRDQFAEMAAQLASLNGHFILSINDRDEIRDLFAWARIKAVNVTYTLSGKPTRHGELIITNFPAEVPDG